MNRLTRQVQIYQDQYQSKAKEGVKVEMAQIIQAMFKAVIEVKKVTKAAAFDDGASVSGASTGSK